jgi:hypothetical protein
MEIIKLKEELRQILEGGASVEVSFDLGDVPENLIWIFIDGKMVKGFTNDFANSLSSYLFERIELPEPTQSFDYEGSGMIAIENENIVISYKTNLIGVSEENESDLEYGGHYVKTFEVLEKYSGK